MLRGCSERLAIRNAGFIRQSEMPQGPLPDKSGVPVVVEMRPERTVTHRAQ